MTVLIRHIINRTYRPLVKRYLAKERRFSHGGLVLRVHPEVFHPGFFYSTKLLLAQLNKLPLEGKQLLELGAGSGLIAMTAARKKAIVTATDINPVAVDYLHRNSRANHVMLHIAVSDVFEQLLPAPFDIIIINPPYYKKKPLSYADYAWYCGENGEYFAKLFSRLAAYIHSSSTVLMVLCDSCDLKMVMDIASRYAFSLHCIHTRRNLVETNYIYTITAA